jgi:hypothetical protein
MLILPQRLALYLDQVPENSEEHFFGNCKNLSIMNITDQLKLRKKAFCLGQLPKKYNEASIEGGNLPKKIPPRPQ